VASAGESRDEAELRKRGAEAFAPLALVLVVAALLRFWLLGSHLPLWCDELASLQRLALPFKQHLSAMQGNHPLYEILLRLWMPPDGSDFWIRVPSAALGVLSVWLTYLLLRSVGRREALLGAALMAFAPLHIMYSRIARPYSLACTLALLSNLSFLWAMKRRRLLPLVAYAVTTALMIYSNLLAAGVWVGQGIFLLWFYRRRPRRLGGWIGANITVGLLILPWMIFSMKGAVTWGQETTYTAQQMGRVFKVARLAMALCVGETVHPLNLKIVPAAFTGFGVAMVLGVFHVLRRRNGVPAFLLAQVVVGFGTALYFSAAAPKHLTTILPAWMGLIAIGLMRTRLRNTAALCACLIVLTMCASNANYLRKREFADADMATPWRSMARYIRSRVSSSGDACPVLVGYRPDLGAFDMFNRYKDATLRTERLDFGDWRAQIRRAMTEKGSVILLLHDGDPWDEIAAWLRREYGGFDMAPFQEEEHTLKGLREWRGARAEYASFFQWLAAMPGYAHMYWSPLYRVYHVGRRRWRPTGGDRAGLSGYQSRDPFFGSMSARRMASRFSRNLAMPSAMSFMSDSSPSRCICLSHKPVSSLSFSAAGRWRLG